MIARQVGELIGHDPGTRLGADPEELHQARVATRRLRAVLRAARPLLDPAWTESLRGELAWLGGSLGPVRDLDVLLARLREEIADLEPEERRAAGRFLRLLEAERRTAREAILDALSSPRYADLLDRLEAAAVSPRARAADVYSRPLRAESSGKLRKAVRALPLDPSDEELHAVRIQGKRARYAGELAEGVVEARAALPPRREALPGRHRRAPGRCRCGRARSRAARQGKRFRCAPRCRQNRRARAPAPPGSPRGFPGGLGAAGEEREAGLELTATGETVQAAGGVVYRRGQDDVEVLLVHRPRYDDWTFLKGKLELGETHEGAAVREVEEETGSAASSAASSRRRAIATARLGRSWFATGRCGRSAASSNRTTRSTRSAGSPSRRRQSFSHERDHEVLHVFAAGENE